MREFRPRRPRAARVFESLAEEQKHLPEAAFQRMVVGIGKQAGYIVRYEHSRIYSPAGYPDLTLVRVEKFGSEPSSSRLIYAELKSLKGIPTGPQVLWLETLYQVGAEVYLWRPEHYNEVVEVLAARHRPDYEPDTRVTVDLAALKGAWANIREQWVGKTVGQWA